MGLDDVLEPGVNRHVQPHDGLAMKRSVRTRQAVVEQPCQSHVDSHVIMIQLTRIIYSGFRTCRATSETLLYIRITIQL